jgi:hypothetical protein
MPAFGFPISGIDKGRASPEEDLATSPDLSNARPYDSKQKIAQGGQRDAFVKKYAQQIGGENLPIVAMTTVTAVT